MMILLYYPVHADTSTLCDDISTLHADTLSLHADTLPIFADTLSSYNEDHPHKAVEVFYLI